MYSALFRVVAFAAAIAMIEGSRKERLVGVCFLAYFILYQGSLYTISDYGIALPVILGVQAGAVLLFAWLAWQTRARWVLLLSIVQVGAVAAWAMSFHHIQERNFWRELVLFYGFDGAKGACFAYAAIAAMVRGPRPPPTAGESDPDLLSLARERWPHALAEVGTA